MAGIFNYWKNRKQVLGMNERNLNYVRRYNTAKAKAIADDKLETKKVLAAAKIPAPQLLGVINNLQQLNDFDWDSLPKSFVIKPVSGLEGGGIEIFFNRDTNGNWVKADGSRYSIEDLKAHAADIIDGKFSLHNQPDKVFFEERVRMHKGFQYYAYKGVPDVRIVVFNKIPVMAMLRLPTQESDGKGNLQMGAIGAGIDIQSGVTTSGVAGKSTLVEIIPSTKLNISGLKIPYWDRILSYAVKASTEIGLGFTGIDFLIDRDKGPLVVEVNARPGLSIQLANRDGLRWRLRKAKGINVQSSEKGVRLAKDLFGGGIAEDIERISGKNLIGIYEDITIFNAQHVLVSDQPRELAQSKRITKQDKKKTSEIKTKAKIDTGADSTSLDISVANELGYGEYIDAFIEICAKLNVPSEFEFGDQSAVNMREQVNKLFQDMNLPLKTYVELVRSSHGRSLRQYITIFLKLGGYEYQTETNLFDRSKLKYKIIVGRKSLNRFLVEPSRKIL